MLNIPNLEAAPTFDAQSIPDSTDLAAQLAAAQQTGVISGCGVTAQSTPNMTVQVAGGTVVVAGVVVAVSAVSSLTVAAASASDRKDIVVVNSSGTVSVVQGTPCGTAGWSHTTANPYTNPPPVKPAIPASSVLLGEIYVAASTTAIGSGNLIDKTTPTLGGQPLALNSNNITNLLHVSLTTASAGSSTITSLVSGVTAGFNPGNNNADHMGVILIETNSSTTVSSGTAVAKITLGTSMATATNKLLALQAGFGNLAATSFGAWSWVGDTGYGANVVNFWQLVPLFDLAASGTWMVGYLLFGA